MVIPGGEAAASELAALGQAVEFVKDQFRHGKPILVFAGGEALLASAGIPGDDEEDWALTRQVSAFVRALARHRNWERQTDPPLV